MILKTATVIPIRSTHSTCHTAGDGASALGIHGVMPRGDIMADMIHITTGDGTTHGITEDGTIHGTTADGTDGMTLGTTEPTGTDITIADGTEDGIRIGATTTARDTSLTGRNITGMSITVQGTTRLQERYSAAAHPQEEVSAAEAVQPSETLTEAAHPHQARPKGQTVSPRAGARP